MRLPVTDLIDRDHVLDQLPDACTLQERGRNLRASVGQRRDADTGLLQRRHCWRHIGVGIELDETGENLVDCLPIDLAQFLLEQKR